MSFWDDAKSKLSGAPDTVITAGLLAMAAFIVIVALVAHPLIKAAVLAWVVFP
jgi:hypothetical protein